MLPGFESRPNPKLLVSWRSFVQQGYLNPEACGWEAVSCSADLMKFSDTITGLNEYKFLAEE